MEKNKSMLFSKKQIDMLTIETTENLLAVLCQVGLELSCKNDKLDRTINYLRNLII